MILTTRIQAIALAAAALVGTQTASAAIATKCVNCSSTQMYNSARSQGPGTVTIWNPVNGEAHRYVTYCGHPNAVDPGSDINKKGITAPKSNAPVSNAGGCNPMTTEEDYLSQDTLDVASALSAVYNATNGSLTLNPFVPLTSLPFPAYAPGLPSAHDFQRDMQLQAQLRDFASAPPVLSQGSWNSNLIMPLRFLAAHADGMMGFTEGMQLQITFVFSDGSTVTFDCVLGKLANYVPGSAHDSTGHLLPDPVTGSNSNYYPGKWYYAPGQGGDLAAFVAYLQSLGIPVTSGTGRPGGIVSCTYNPQTHDTACIEYQ